MILTCAICATSDDLWTVQAFTSTGASIDELACISHIGEVASAKVPTAHVGEFWVIVPYKPPS